MTRIPLIFAFFGIFTLLLSCCKGDQKETCLSKQGEFKPGRELVIIIGEDRSATFVRNDNKMLSETDLVQLKDMVLASNMSGKIMFSRVGNPSKAGFENCYLEKYPELKSGAALNVKAAWKKQCREICVRNTQKLGDFIQKCSPLLGTKQKDNQTDLNGFFELSKTFIDGGEGIVILNSDGKQDCQKTGGKKFNCKNLPEGAIYLVSGNKKELGCTAANISQQVDFESALRTIFK